MILKTQFIGMTMLCIVISSCGSSIESDAKRTADLKCKAEHLMRQVISGDATVSEESKKLNQEATDLYNEMKKKYSAKEERTMFMKAFIQESSKCEP